MLSNPRTRNEAHALHHIQASRGPGKVVDEQLCVLAHARPGMSDLAGARHTASVKLASTEAFVSKASLGLQPRRLCRVPSGSIAECLGG